MKKNIVRIVRWFITILCAALFVAAEMIVIYLSASTQLIFLGGETIYVLYLIGAVMVGLSTVTYLVFRYFLRRVNTFTPRRALTFLGIKSGLLVTVWITYIYGVVDETAVWAIPLLFNAFIIFKEVIWPHDNRIERAKRLSNILDAPE